MIGVFDSGIGGLTVAKAIRDRAPDADMLYFGDCDFAPYGPRSPEALRKRTQQILSFLQSQGVEEFAAACNSVCVSSIPPVGNVFGIDRKNVVEMVGPATRVAQERDVKRLLVFATEATVRSELYSSTIRRAGIDVKMCAVPKLAGLIEAGGSEEEIERVVTEVISGTHDYAPDAVLFGCTHYPFVADVFTRIWDRFDSRPIPFIDPATSVASDVLNRFECLGTGSTRVLTTKNTPAFQAYCYQVFGVHVQIEVIDIDRAAERSSNLSTVSVHNLVENMGAKRSKQA